MPKSLEKFKIAQGKRNLKQFVMTPLFIAILCLGWQFPWLGYFIPACMLLGISIGLVRGRKWCDWYCPRGSFYDALLSRISFKRNIPLIFRNMYLRIAVIIIVFSIMAINLIRLWPEAYQIGKFFVAMVTLTTVLGVLLAIFIHPRAWCMICPVGTIENWVGAKKALLKIDSELCVECRLCGKICPVQIKPYTYNKSIGIKDVKEGDCIKCNLCIAICPRKALSSARS